MTLLRDLAPGDRFAFATGQGGTGEQRGIVVAAPGSNGGIVIELLHQDYDGGRHWHHTRTEWSGLVRVEREER